MDKWNGAIYFPDMPVKAHGSIIFDLINPELQQTTLDSEYQLKGAEAELNNLKAQLQNQLMDQRAEGSR